MLTPLEYQEKQARNLKNATSDIRAGIDKVKEAPTAKAAEKQTKMLANLTKAVNDGTWKNGLLKVSLEQWKTAARDIGVDRIPAGIDGAKNKVIAFATQFLPEVERIAAEVRRMPDLTLSDSIARMTKQVTDTSKFKLK